MIRIGTSGYSYKDWVGPFYPETIKPNQMLKYYSQEFDFTEINSTYYKVPDPKNFYKMAEITPIDFTFSVKLFGGMTHTRDAAEGDYRKFLQGLQNLQDCDKLSYVIAQFPNSFRHEPKNVAYLEELMERFRDYKLAVEFRSDTMINVKMLELLRSSSVGLISVDEPKLKGLVDQGVFATNRSPYIRFHGRNESKWYNNKASQERYDYLYSEKELSEWSGPILGMEHSMDDIFVSFNNHFNGQAVVNARMMKQLLGIQ